MSKSARLTALAVMLAVGLVAAACSLNVTQPAGRKTIVGGVYDLTTSQPIANAEVLVAADSSASADTLANLLTAGDGSFGATIDNVPDGAVIYAVAAGYRTSAKAKLGTSDHLAYTIRLQPVTGGQQ